MMNLPKDVARSFRDVYERVMPRVVEQADALGSELTLPDLSELDNYELVHTTSPFGVDMGKANYILIHKTSKLTRSVKLKLPGSHNLIIIGANVDLGSTSISCFGKFGALVIADNSAFKNCRIATKHRSVTAIIGAKMSWVAGALLVAEDNNSVVIGDNCLFSWDIEIMPTDGHPIYDSESGDRINPPAPIVIHEGVWLSKGASISKGVRLGRGCIIGQKSLVTKDTEANCVYAGVPAKLIRRNVLWRQSLKHGSNIKTGLAIDASMAKDIDWAEDEGASATKIEFDHAMSLTGGNDPAKATCPPSARNREAQG